MTRPIVDAIVCYHNHEGVIRDCLKSLETQVRHILIIDDGSKLPLQGHPVTTIPASVRILRRDAAHGPANSFNYGATQALLINDAKPDYFLYVDPHNIYQPRAVQAMVDLAEEDHYDVVFGTGRHFILDGSDPWIRAIGPTINTHDAPWTCIITRRLWEQWLPPGIPETRHAPFSFLADMLEQRGVLVGMVYGCCDHVVNGDHFAAIKYFYESGRMFGVLYKDGFKAGDHTAIGAQVQAFNADKIQLLWEMLFVSAYQLGALEGVGNVPQEDLKIKLGFRWKE